MDAGAQVDKLTTIVADLRAVVTALNNLGPGGVAVYADYVEDRYGKRVSIFKHVAAQLRAGNDPALIAATLEVSIIAINDSIAALTRRRSLNRGALDAIRRVAGRLLDYAKSLEDINGRAIDNLRTDRFELTKEFGDMWTLVAEYVEKAKEERAYLKVRTPDEVPTWPAMLSARSTSYESTLAHQ